MLLSFLSRIGLPLFLILVTSTIAVADPCGMVPPITSENPIVRVGLQKTYVFHKNDTETFVIRPGFSGNVDNFGMLIPFPSIPEIRKVPDAIFTHLANAIDPPEVTVQIWQGGFGNGGFGFGGGGGGVGGGSGGFLGGAPPSVNVVQVVKEEAVGMYEVAVLAAGSAESLKKWMTNHGYQYPTGMDEVVEEYVKQQWGFVAVKTKVSDKSGVDPKPAQRATDGKMKSGSVFDGFVQAMGFRFKSEKLVLPMRLSTFNEGDLRNVVYILSEGPRKIRNIPEEYVVRQIEGDELYKNLTDPLPLRIIGGTAADLSADQRRNLKTSRNPVPHNGLAAELFAADLVAIRTGKLSLFFEEQEKQLLQISEALGMRGNEIDKVHTQSLKKKADRARNANMRRLETMTLTVVDGDFPREVLAGDNLHFDEFKMAMRLNNSINYDANRYGPGQQKDGILIRTSLNLIPDAIEQPERSYAQNKSHFLGWLFAVALLTGACWYLGWFKRT